MVIREADIQRAAGGDDGVVVEAAVGAHRQLPARPGVAHPRHRLTQEVGGAAGSVGAALAQPRHQHVTRPGRNGEQRVIAAHARVAVVAGALLMGSDQPPEVLWQTGSGRCNPCQPVISQPSRGF